MNYADDFEGHYFPIQFVPDRKVQEVSCSIGDFVPGQLLWEDWQRLFELEQICEAVGVEGQHLFN
jgi:hypothetical protein